MSNPAYLIMHKDHRLDVHGVNSGAEMATLFLARFLVQEGKRVVVCGQLVEGEEEYDGVQFWNLGEDFNTTRCLKRADEELEFYHLICASRAQAALESRDNPHCLSRSLISHDRSGNDTGISPKVLGKVADNIICVSHVQSKLFLEHEVETDKVHVIHNGVDLDLFGIGSPEARDYNRIVFVGALVQDKGIHFLVQSFAELKMKYPDLKLDVYGSAALWGREKFLDEKSIEAQVPGIKFHGGVDQKIIVEAYQNAGIAAVPSIWFDPFPLSAIEAQVTGCPVVTFNVGGLPEGVRHEETGIVLKDISPEALTGCLDGLLSNPEKLKWFSRNSIELARPYFTWERVAKHVIRICEEASAKRSPELSTSSPVDKTELTETKLGFLSTWNQECGLATYARFMLSEFPENTYVVFGEDSTGDRNREDETFVRRCWKRDSSDFSALESEINKSGIKLLYLNCHHRFFPQPQFSEFLDRIRSGGVRVILHLHTVFTVDEKLTSAVKSVDAAIVHTPESRLELIANGCDANVISVVTHGVDVKKPLEDTSKAEVRRKYGLPEDKPVIVSFGFVQPHKGMEAVLEAVAHLKARGIEAHGYIAGKPNDQDSNSSLYQEQLQNAAKQLDIESRIHFLNRFLEESEVTDYLQAADLVMMNYKSNYYEASGACSLAIGAGAVVATSIAPAFLGFGEAVWHMTGGYPAGVSAELLLNNQELRTAIKENASEFCADNNWKKVYEKLLTIFKTQGMLLSDISVEESEGEEGSTGSDTQTGSGEIRVLMQNRSNVFTQRGGDTIVMEKLIAGLEQRGVKVTVDVESKLNPADFDLVHLFNFALPDLLRAQAERAVQAGTPYVITTLCEDVPEFHFQSHTLAAALIQYVANNQDRSWWKEACPDLSQVPKSPMFDNSWAAEHAAALLTNGEQESLVVKKHYGQNLNILEVPLGHEIGETESSADFVKEYGVKDFIFCVGRLESRKNQLMLLKALEDSELPIVLAGGGFTYQPEYAEAARLFRRRGQTLILDRISPEMLTSAYRAARVHALPSWYELPGLVSLEAAHYGCNVVVTSKGTSKDYLGEQAYYCNPDSEETIFSSVMSAYNTPFKKVITEIAMKYTWDETVEETRRAYQQITGIGDSPPVEKTLDLKLGTAGYDMAADSTEFQDVLERGELAARSRDYTLALDCFSRALRMNPASGRALRGSGAVSVAEGNLQEARGYFEKAVELDAFDAKALSGLGMCEMDHGEAQTAYEYFLRALHLDSEHLVTMLQFIECAYVLRRYEDLIQVLRQYTMSHSEDMHMRYCLAGALFKAGESAEALVITDDILAKDPENAGAKQLGELLRAQIAEKQAEAPESEPEVLKNDSAPLDPPTSLDQGTPQAELTVETVVGDAIAKLQETRNSESESDSVQPPVIQQEFDDTDRKLQELEELKHYKEYAKAVELSEEILKETSLRPDQEEKARLVQAEILVMGGEGQAATDIFEKVLSKNPSSARAMCGKGALFASQGNWTLAAELFDKARNLDTDNDIALAGLGLISTVNREPEKAWDYYQQALEKNPENGRALLGVLELGYPLGKLKEVEKVVARYLDMHPGDLEYVYALAGCYFAQDRLDESLSELNRILLFDPENQRANELKGIIEEKQSQSSSAG